MGRVPGSSVGVDVGATLAKIAWRTPERALEFRLEPSSELDAVAALVSEREPAHVGVTGGGAAELARRLEGRGTPVNEFAAWGAGAKALLERAGGPPAGRYLLVSLGTGTSVMLADGRAGQRRARQPRAPRRRHAARRPAVAVPEARTGRARSAQAGPAAAGDARGRERRLHLARSRARGVPAPVGVRGRARGLARQPAAGSAGGATGER